MMTILSLYLLCLLSLYHGHAQLLDSTFAANSISNIFLSQNQPINPVNPARGERELYPMMYEYGPEHLDMELFPQPNLDRQIDLEFYFPFYGFRYNYTFISPNGYIAFSMPRWIQPPYTFPNPKWPEEPDPSFIAPFFSQATYQFVGNQRLSHVWYRTVHRSRLSVDQSWTNTDTFSNMWSSATDRQRKKSQAGLTFDDTLLDRITRDIHDGFSSSYGFMADHALIVTWERMGFGGAPKVIALNEFDQAKHWQNTYQMVIASDEIRSFVTFNYGSLNWTSSFSAGALGGRGGKQSAIAGFNGGNSTGFTALPYSGQGDIFMLSRFMSSVMPGRWVYRVDEVVTQGGCSNSSTGSLLTSPNYAVMFGGLSYNVSGPCLRPGDSVVVLFDELAVTCQRVNMGYARCIMPMIYKVGYIILKLSVDGGKSFPFLGSLYITAPHLGALDISLGSDALNPHNNFDRPDAELLSISWNNWNLTWNAGAHVDVEVLGYWEHAQKSEWKSFGFVARDIANTGSYEFDPRLLSVNQSILDRDFRRLSFGALRINVVDDYYAGYFYSPLTPLAWFFREAWIDKYGSNWPTEKCLEWFGNEGRRSHVFKSVATDHTCPCVLSQAVADFGRFIPILSCDKDGNSNCPFHRGARHCVMSAFPTSNNKQQVCCYDFDGYLILSDDYDVIDRLRFYSPGTPRRAHEHGHYPYKLPKRIPSLSYWHRDIRPYYLCCKWSNMCEFYFWRRQSSACQDYYSPRLALAYGNGHFVTFDGNQYTFNGNGYFTLLLNDDPSHRLVVQVRMEQPQKNLYNQYPNATIITGVAMQENSSDVIEILVRNDYRRWRQHTDVFINGGTTYFDGADVTFQVFKEVQIFNPSLNLDMSDFYVQFSSGAGVRVTESNGALSVAVSLPGKFNATAKNSAGFDRPNDLQNMYKTYGLLGLFNSDPLDDHTTPDGTRVSVPSYKDVDNAAKSRLLHYAFGELWRVDGTNVVTGSVLFQSGLGPVYSPHLFQSNSYRPNFDPLEISPRMSLLFTLSDVRSVCQGNFACQFDYVHSGSSSFAKTTLNTESNFLSLKSAGEIHLVSCGGLYRDQQIKKTPTGNNYLDGVTVKFDCRSRYYTHGDTERTCLNGTWTPGWFAWCRSRQVEHAMKWITGVLVSLSLAAIIVGIYITMYWLNVRPKHRRTRAKTARVMQSPSRSPIRPSSPHLTKPSTLTSSYPTVRLEDSSGSSGNKHNMTSFQETAA